MKKFNIPLRTLCLSFILSGTIFILSSFIPVFAQDTIPVLRLSGDNRYKTAEAISREGWKTSEYIILSVGEGDKNFADALACSPLSYAINAPVLLTPTDKLLQSTIDEIIRLNAKKAILLGGTGAISSNVENQLQNMGLSVDRLWGLDRYGTSVQIAERLRIGRPFTRVFLTTGEEFQYSMMIAPFASTNGIPILYTENSYLSPIVEDSLKRWGVYEVDIIGNNNVISQSMEKSLKAIGITVSRVQGSGMAETNINIISKYHMETEGIAFARDDVFADGLAGTAFAALKNMHIILTGQNSSNPVISDFLNNYSHNRAYIFGGPGAVSDYIIPLIRKGDSQSALYGNTAGNINCGGLAVSRDGWIYYHNAVEGGKLYRIKSDGSAKKEICSDIPLSINIMGDWIYYINLSDNSSIYKVRKDGTCRVRLNDDESQNAVVIDNWIYYMNKSDNGYIYRITTDGSLKTKLSSHSSKSINVEWDWIYYINNDDGGKITRLKRDDPSVLQGLKAIYAANMDMADGCIYFSNEEDNRKLYKINTDGTGLSKLCDDTVYDIQVIGDSIYYSNAGDGNKLYKIKTDGTGRATVFDGSAYLLNIADDWIYFFKDQDGLMLYKVRADGSGLSQVN